MPTLPVSLLLALVLDTVFATEFDKCDRADAVWAGFDQVLQHLRTRRPEDPRLRLSCHGRASVFLMFTP